MKSCVRSVLALALALFVPPSVAAWAGPLNAEAADAAERAALLDLGLRDRATADDYRLVERLLGLVQDRSATPTADRARHAAMAAWRAGDRDAMLDHSKEVVRRDPSDTVALLRVVSEQISELQTVEQRLAAIRALLSERGESIDPAVRSRLALDGALLLRETGDADGSLRMLGESLRLDPSNKPAAALLVREIEARTDDPEKHLTAQIALLMADPVDPHVHAVIARTLASAREFAAARRFMNHALTIASLAGSSSPTLLRESLVLAWLLEGPERVIDLLQQDLTNRRARAEAAWEQAIELDEPTEGLTPPDEVRLDVTNEELRLAAALAAGDAAVVEVSVAELNATLEQLIREQREKLGTLPESERERFVEGSLALIVRLQMARLVAGVDVPRAVGEMNQLMESVPQARVYFRQLQPLVAVRAGEPERALRLADEMGEATLTTRLARIEALAALGRNAEAADAAIELSDTAVLIGWGAYAVTRAAQLDPRTREPSPVGRRMAERAARIPAWIDRMIAQPSSYMSLQAKPAQTTYAAGRPVELRLELTNVAPVPLGFGSDRTISSRLLITPDLDQHTPGFVGSPQPSVIEADRRLRLRPRETLVMLVPADSPYTHWLVGTNAQVTTRQRWRVLQDFQLGSLNAPVKGPIALSTETVSVHREALPEANLSAADLAERIRTAEGERSAQLYVAARARLFAGGGGPVSPLVEALIERFDAAGTNERVSLLTEIPPASFEPDLAPFDAHVLERLAADAGSYDTIVLALAVLTRVTDAESVVFDAVASADPRLVSIAGIIRGRLERDEQTTATAGGGVDAFSGPTPSRLRELIRRRRSEER